MQKINVDPPLMSELAKIATAEMISSKFFSIYKNKTHLPNK